jgi:hypothetical protein
MAAIVHINRLPSGKKLANRGTTQKNKLGLKVGSILHTLIDCTFFDRDKLVSRGNKQNPAQNYVCTTFFISFILEESIISTTICNN